MEYQDDEFSNVAMKRRLEILLNRLENLAIDQPVIFSEPVSECMTDAITNAFLLPKQNYELPDDYNTGSLGLDAQLKHALADYIEATKPAAAAFGANTPHDRLIIFQDLDVESQGGYVQDDFFEWSDFIG